MPNICNFSPIRLSERAINERFRFIQRDLCYVIAQASSNLTQVYTQNSATITWSGNGTQADPLIATVIGQPTGANPTAQVDLSVTNGVATTFMRSDAAPALNQSIVPTWTGQHTFTANATSLLATVALKNISPQWELWNTLGGTDSKRWTTIAGPTNYILSTLSDDGQAIANVYRVVRAANVVQSHEFFTTGNTRMTVASTGRVGIGTTSPVGKLHISTGVSAITSSGPNNGMLLTDNTNFCRFYMENTASTAGQRVFAIDNSVGVFSLSSYTDIATSVTTNNIFSFTHSGTASFSSLIGTGTRMVVANASGTISTQAIGGAGYNPQSGTTYTVVVADTGKIIGLSNIAARTITLPAASAIAAGIIIYFKDEAGTATTANITIDRAGADTIDGATSLVINQNFQVKGIYSNGTNAWFVM